ncbi:MAG: hypothetical protein H7Y00_13220 [Fimbriimonadaceae bacterium]|nr:hypothetical protein [Chitinophagales bacterium]
MKDHKTDEGQAKQKSGMLTLIIAGCIVTMLFLFAFRPPFPPHEAEGFLVDFGFDETGFGTEEPTNVASAPASGGQISNDEPVTQDVEDAITLPEKKKLPKTTNTSSTSTSTNTNNQSQEKIDDKQIFKNDKKLEGKGTSEGNKPGTEGNMGKEDGDPNGGYDDGDGLGNNPGSSGVGHDLKGRSLKKNGLSSNSMEAGKIVFKITVDKNGYIRSAEYQRSGSTIVDQGVISNVKNQLLNKQWFNPKTDAPETQTGNLTVNISMS